MPEWWTRTKSRTLQRARKGYGLLITCTVVGAAIGMLCFGVGLLAGGYFFATVGAILGLVGAFALIALQSKRAHFALTEVEINVPGLAGTFVVNSDYRKAAWQLFIETMTRIATQPLDPDEGRLREALASLYSLFQTTRNLLKEIAPTPTTEGRTVEMLALEMLNRHLRPFLSRWHPQVPILEKPQAHTPFDEATCRTELEHLRLRLVEFARAYGQLAGIRQLDAFFDG